LGGAWVFCEGFVVAVEHRRRREQQNRVSPPDALPASQSASAPGGPAERRWGARLGRASAINIFQMGIRNLKAFNVSN
jgi:hypothetical protein